MSNITADTLAAFDWKPQPDAPRFVRRMIDSFCRQCPDAAQLALQLKERTGTRLVDWIDHLALPVQENLKSDLAAVGFAPSQLKSPAAWEHAGGLFPTIEVGQQQPWRSRSNRSPIFWSGTG